MRELNVNEMVMVTGGGFGNFSRGFSHFGAAYWLWNFGVGFAEALEDIGE